MLQKYIVTFLVVSVCFRFCIVLFFFCLSKGFGLRNKFCVGL